MKQINLALMLFLCFAVFSCGSDNPIIPGGGSTVTNISGTISGAPNEALIIRVLLSGNGNNHTYSDTISAGAAFDIALDAPPANVLRKINTFTGGDTIFVVSDTNASYAIFSGVTVSNSADSLIGSATRKNFNDSAVVGSFITQYMYSDRAVTIIGTRTSITGSDTSIIIVALNLAAGWNVINYQRAAFTTTSNTLLVASGEPSGASWRFESLAPPPANMFRRYLMFAF